MVNNSTGDSMNFNEVFMIVPRSLISLVVLFFVTKLIGKKQVSEFSLFDYVIGISIGNFTAEMTMNFDNQYINGIVAIVTFGFVAYLVSVLSMKSIFIRRVVVGVPTVIIENGKILFKSLDKVKIDLNDLLEQARNAGYFDLSEIAFAIMEVNGKVSFLVKDQYKEPTKKDLKIKPSNDSLCANVIIDSKLMIKNISNTDKDVDWFKQQLKVLGYADYSNILLATYKDGKITVYKKDNSIPKDILE